MKLEMTQGCICDWLGVDGIREVDMTPEQREPIFNKINEFLKQQPDGLNQLLQLVLELYGDWDCTEEACECCGDYIYNYKLDI